MEGTAANVLPLGATRFMTGVEVSAEGTWPSGEAGQRVLNGCRAGSRRKVGAC